MWCGNTAFYTVEKGSTRTGFGSYSAPVESRHTYQEPTVGQANHVTRSSTILPPMQRFFRSAFVMPALHIVVPWILSTGGVPSGVGVGVKRAGGMAGGWFWAKKFAGSLPDTFRQGKKFTGKLAGTCREGKNFTDKLAGTCREGKKFAGKLAGTCREGKKFAGKLAGTCREGKKFTGKLAGTCLQEKSSLTNLQVLLVGVPRVQPVILSVKIFR